MKCFGILVRNGKGDALASVGQDLVPTHINSGDNSSLLCVILQHQSRDTQVSCPTY